MTLAIIAIGYADGISRSLSNKGLVFTKKNIFKIVGRVSMDTIIVDITKIKKNEVILEGDYLELINYKYGIDFLADQTGTICDEILTSISSRVVRKYV